MKNFTKTESEKNFHGLSHAPHQSCDIYNWAWASEPHQFSNQ